MPMRTLYQFVPLSRPKKLTRVIFLAALLFAGIAHAQTAIPDTPAGRAFRAWLDAFDSGDRAKVEAYTKKFEPQQSAQSMMDFYNQTGGFDLLAIESSQPLLLKFRVKERASSTIAMGSIEIKDAQSGVVEGFKLQAIPLGAVVESVKLDAAERERVIDGLAKNLNDFYVYPDLARKMEDAIRANQRRGDYDAITDPDVFADRLTQGLQNASHDKHLSVDYNAVKLPAEVDKPSSEEVAQFRKMLEKTNCSFTKVEILPHNIGYLKFNAFLEPTI